MLRNFIVYTIIFLGSLAGLSAHAQRMVGDWQVYSVFDGKDISDIIDTDNKVFYVSAGRLYSYDKENNETYSYSTRNKLNDTEVSRIFYNRDGGYLMICYANGNIDLLYLDDDHSVNLGDIADATITESKTINDVAFHDGRIYVGTGFGLVVFDDKHHHVIESARYSEPVTAITVSHGNLVIFQLNAKCLYAPLEIRHNSVDKFSPLRNFMARDAYTTGNNLLFRRIGENDLYMMEVDWEAGTANKPISLVAKNITQPLYRHTDGTFTATSPDTIYTISAQGAITAKTVVPSALKGSLISFVDTPASLWAADDKGLANYSLKDGQLTVLSDKFAPEAITCKQVAFIAGSPDGSRVYLSNLGGSRSSTLGGGPASDGLFLRQRTDVLSDGIPADAAISNVTLYKTQSYQKQNGDSALYGGMQRIVVDPQKPNRYYIATFLEGVFVCEDTDGDGVYEETGRFTVENMPIHVFWAPTNRGAMASDVNFDPEGNLWVGVWEYDPSQATYFRYSPYLVLPKNKLYGDLSQIKATDWVPSAHLGKDVGEKNMGTVISKSGIICNWDSRDSQPLRVIDTKKTWTNMADDVFRELVGVTDQDNKTWNPTRWICGVEDKRGRIWLGTTSGIVEITNPTTVTNADFRFTRLKVPRNDGTNYADYLLESEQVNGIAVDHSNRKWVATENSGIYLVSENGDAILEHFTAANSELPGNTVTAVYCHPADNTVYFGTPEGLIVYSSNSSPAADDFSDVYAYPNPVRPDYDGWITIKGLKDNSLVKIADVAGHVFYQTRSEGGMVVWDGCNADGSRVRSGVYLVFASANDDGNTAGAVAKIVVIN